MFVCCCEMVYSLVVVLVLLVWVEVLIWVGKFCVFMGFEGLKNLLLCMLLVVRVYSEGRVFCVVFWVMIWLRLVSICMCRLLGW